MTSQLLARLSDVFQRNFHVPPGLVVRAPGRVNLIGEHTDYNDGFVLPCAIDFHTLIAARTRDDALVRVIAVDYAGAIDEFSLDMPITQRADAQWANYVRGVVKQLVDQGISLQGADMVITGNVPQGAGLSSSASLEVAVGQVFKSLQNLQTLSATDLALIGQRAENHFVGVNCGIMDQLISARGKANHALLIDCRSLHVRPVPLPQGLAVMIIHSRVKRGLVESEYNTRRKQCETAAQHFGVKALRDLDSLTLESGAAGLDALTFKRARHVVTENQRTLDASIALSNGDLHRMGELMAQSHASMRDDFEITVPAIDQLVEIVQHDLKAYGGARMTGGGFGGCVVALLPKERVTQVINAIEAHYRAPTGESAIVYVTGASAGASALL